MECVWCREDDQLKLTDRFRRLARIRWLRAREFVPREKRERERERQRKNRISKRRQNWGGNKDFRYSVVLCLECSCCSLFSILRIIWRFSALFFNFSLNVRCCSSFDSFGGVVVVIVTVVVVAVACALCENHIFIAESASSVKEPLLARRLIN